MRIFFAALLLSTLAIPASAQEQPPIRIGELNSYTALPLYTENYRKGWKLAVEEVNAAGGIKGRKVEVVDRDDGGKPETALKYAQELVARDHINFLSGCMFGNVCLALGEFADKNHMPTMRWFGNSWNERKRESQYAFGLLSLFVTARAPAVHIASRHLASWASIAPNYAYGQQATKIFAEELKKDTPATVWHDTYWYPVGQLNAATTIGAIARLKVDAVMNASFGADVAQLIRETKKRDFDKNKTIVSLETGTPENMKTLGAEFPQGWIMTGYPGDDIPDAAHKAFVARYKAKYGETPPWMALNGYVAYRFIFAALEKAPSLKADDIVKAMERVTVDSPVGKLSMRAADHMTNYGIWVGTSAVENGTPKLKDWKYYSGDSLLIAQDKVAK